MDQIDDSLQRGRARPSNMRHHLPWHLDARDSKHPHPEADSLQTSQLGGDSPAMRPDIGRVCCIPSMTGTDESWQCAEWVILLVSGAREVTYFSGQGAEIFEPCGGDVQVDRVEDTCFGCCCQAVKCVAGDMQSVLSMSATEDHGLTSSSLESWMEACNSLVLWL